jgi:hypothetical protein
VRRMAIGLFVAGVFMGGFAAFLEFAVEVGRAENPELSSSIAILPVLSAVIAVLAWGAALYVAGPSKRRTLGVLTGGIVALILLIFVGVRWQSARDDFRRASIDLDPVTYHDFETLFAHFARGEKIGQIDQTVEFLRLERGYVRFARGWVSNDEWKGVNERLEELEQKLTEARKKFEERNTHRSDTTSKR